MASRHSIKVPRLFKTACKIAKLVREEGGSLKELVYSGKHPNIKALYALVVETLQHEKELDTIFEKSKILEKEKGLDPWLARVLITELTWGKKRLLGESKPVQTVLSYKSSFVNDSKGIFDAGNQLEEVDKVCLPRYARVNTINLTVEQAVAYLRDEGWLLAREGDVDMFPTSDHFRLDSHIPEVLAFPPGTELHNHPLVQNCSFLLQDKASCMAAHLLAPSQGSTVLDMCAAPGMKTTHLAARMVNKGTLYAVEKNALRYETLCKFIENSGATCVKALLEDSVQLDDKKIPDVEYILVDPSCSGTGIVNRPKVGDPLGDGVRLRKLVGFQRRLLLNALTSFPNAIRVVYSTCSLLPDENEGVVEWVLKEVASGQHPSGWHLARDPLPGWTNRGCEESYPSIGKHCLYSRTETDLTNGFFLALFERSKELAGCQKLAKGGDMSSKVKKKRARKEGEEENDEEATVTAKKAKKKRRKFEEQEEHNDGATSKKSKQKEAKGEDNERAKETKTKKKKKKRKDEGQDADEEVTITDKRKGRERGRQLGSQEGQEEEEQEDDEKEATVADSKVKGKEEKVQDNKEAKKTKKKRKKEME